MGNRRSAGRPQEPRTCRHVLPRQRAPFGIGPVLPGRDGRRNQPVQARPGDRQNGLVAAPRPSAGPVTLIFRSAGWPATIRVTRRDSSFVRLRRASWRRSIRRRELCGGSTVTTSTSRRSYPIRGRRGPNCRSSPELTSLPAGSIRPRRSPKQSVLLTPRDSDELHCLNLADGTLGGNASAATGCLLRPSWRERSILVGRSSVEALRLSDGNPVWRAPIDMPMPAGRGFRNGHLYHLPLSTGELATIDLRRGRMITRSRFPSNVKPGNMVAADGIRRHAIAVRRAGPFAPTAELEKSLVNHLGAQAGRFAAALAARGELRVDRGQTAAGLDDLFHSLRRRPEQAYRRFGRLRQCSKAFATTSSTAARMPASDRASDRRSGTDGSSFIVDGPRPRNIRQP